MDHGESGPDDPEKFFRVKGCATDEETVHIFLVKVISGIGAFYASAIGQEERMRQVRPLSPITGTG